MTGVGVGVGIDCTSAAVFGLGPTAGTLANQVFTENTGAQTYDVSGQFFGSGLSYSLTTNPDAANITINSSTSEISFDTDNTGVLLGETITVQASNGDGSVSRSFTLNIAAGDALTSAQWAVHRNVVLDGGETALIWVDSAIEPDLVQWAAESSLGAPQATHSLGRVNNDVLRYSPRVWELASGEYLTHSGDIGITDAGRYQFAWVMGDFDTSANSQPIRLLSIWGRLIIEMEADGKINIDQESSTNNEYLVRWKTDNDIRTKELSYYLLDVDCVNGTVTLHSRCLCDGLSVAWTSHAGTFQATAISGTADLSRNGCAIGAQSSGSSGEIAASTDQGGTLGGIVLWAGEATPIDTGDVYDSDTGLWVDPRTIGSAELIFDDPDSMGTNAGSGADMDVTGAPDFRQGDYLEGSVGHGKYTTGGFGGTEVDVTSTAESGTGSLAAALASQTGDNPLIINIKVEGVLTLTTEWGVQDQNNITIRGQTAPGNGLRIKGERFFIYGQNIRLENLQFDLDDSTPGNNSDAWRIGLYSTNPADTHRTRRVYLKNCTAVDAWDEACSIFPRQTTLATGNTVEDVTIEGLITGNTDQAGHEYTLIIGDGAKRVSVTNSLFMNTAGRCVFVRQHTEDVEEVNCVVYNWNTPGYNITDMDGIATVAGMIYRGGNINAGRTDALIRCNNSSIYIDTATIFQDTKAGQSTTLNIYDTGHSTPSATRLDRRSDISAYTTKQQIEDVLLASCGPRRDDGYPFGLTQQYLDDFRVGTSPTALYEHGVTEPPSAMPTPEVYSGATAAGSLWLMSGTGHLLGASESMDLRARYSLFGSAGNSGWSATEKEVAA